MKSGRQRYARSDPTESGGVKGGWMVLPTTVGPDSFHDPTSLHTIQLSGQPLSDQTVGWSCQDVGRVFNYLLFFNLERHLAKIFQDHEFPPSSCLKFNYKETKFIYIFLLFLFQFANAFHLNNILSTFSFNIIHYSSYIK